MNNTTQFTQVIEQANKTPYEIADALAISFRGMPRHLIRNDSSYIDCINQWHLNLSTNGENTNRINLVIAYCNVLFYRVTGNYEQLFRWGLKQLSDEYELNDYKYLGWIHRLLSAVSSTIGLIDQAVDHGHKALYYFELLENAAEINNCFIQLGIAYDYTNNYDIQLEYFEKSFNFAKENNERTIEKNALNNIIYVLILRNEYALAKEKIGDLFNLIEKNETSPVVVTAHLNALRIALYEKNNEAIWHYINLIETFPLLEIDQTWIMDLKLLIGRSFLLENNIKSAIEAFNCGYSIAESLNSTKYKLDFLEAFTKISLLKKDFETAFHHQENFIKITRELEHEKAGYKYLVLRIQYEVDHINREVNQLRDQLNYTKESTIYTLATLAEYKDQITGKHILRTIEYVEGFCQLINSENLLGNPLKQEYIDNFSRSSALHDIGKVGISDEILKKPGKLTAHEFEQMKKHTVLGRDALSITKSILGRASFLKLAQVIAYSHHEKWDGSGYPEGLAGEDIPFEGRLVAIIDVYDALISKRPYKEPFSHLKALSILKEGRGTHFDPTLVDLFIAHHERFLNIAMRLIDTDEEKTALVSTALT